MPRRKPAASDQQPATKRRRGAPRGNLNALRTGQRSEQLKLLTAALYLVPELRNVIEGLARKRARGSSLELRAAVEIYRALLDAPSRQRSIRAIRRQAKLRGRPRRI